MQKPSTYCANLDLFGSVPVTLDDVDFWLDVVPKIPRTSPRRREYYFANWDVVNKIIQSKLSGHFYQLEELAEEPQPMRLSVILHQYKRTALN